MNKTINNGFLRLEASSLGAQMLSLNAHSIDYLWSGERLWTERAPVLFPFVGRLFNEKYRLGDAQYSIPIHGFALTSEFELLPSSADELLFHLGDSVDTCRQYPFHFDFYVKYHIVGSSVEIDYTVCNKSDETMPFGLGSHPGFAVPFVPNTAFEDYYLEFPRLCRPDKIGFTEQRLLTGADEAYLLEGERILRLRHELFDDDALVLKNIPRCVTLRCCKSKKAVRIEFPDMPYIGIWHWPRSNVPYVCIEPWTSLPGRQNVIEDITCRSDLVQLKPHSDSRFSLKITLLEE